MPQHEFFAPCPRGLDRVTADEIRSMGIKPRPLGAGVEFHGTLADAYRVCLWSRTASRVMLVLARGTCRDAQELYAGVRSIPWEAHIPSGATISVDARGVNDELRNTQFTAQRVKDAICDRMREATGERPDVAKKDPDLRISVALRGEKITIYLNLSGAPLHERGYRQAGVQGAAPMKEALAAGMLLLAGFPQGFAAGEAFLDPLCGSGTLAVEAALMAYDRAPGLLRKTWGFSKWKQHDAAAWDALVAEARDRADAALAAAPGAPSGPASTAGSASAAAPELRIFGADKDPRAIDLARACARRAGVSDLVGFQVQDFCERTSSPRNIPAGLVATNPPYGERLSTRSQLPVLYANLAGLLRRMPGWRSAIITSDPALDQFLRMRKETSYDLFNGALEVKLHCYAAMDAAVVAEEGLEEIVDPAMPSVKIHDREFPVYFANSQEYVNRLAKRFQHMRKWARRQEICAYRLYDADLPDYNLAVDLYQDVPSGEWYAVVCEYAAPSHVDADKASQRLADALIITPAVLGIPSERVFLKERRRTRPEKWEDGQHESCVITTAEHGYRFEANLSDYLDTGIFLDHRPARALVADLVKQAGESRAAKQQTGKDEPAKGESAEDKPVKGQSGKGQPTKRQSGKSQPSFLNLFAYTGTATVHAAGAGAQTTTVDLSQTYLAWAERNMRANGFTGPEHIYERSDVMRWITQARRDRRAYDVIFVDPPSYSNSKKTGNWDWDVQRDHVELLVGVSRLLKRGGIAVFSCNLRSFKPDLEELQRLGVELEDISAQTIDEDFARNPKIHRCYLVRRA